MGAFKDLTGQKFNKLTVLWRAGSKVKASGGKDAMWHCLCDCGNECDVSTYNLKHDKIKSCGCLKHEGKYEDLTGQRFGKLTVISRAENKGKNVAWNCQCDCGKQTIVTTNQLKSGHTKSCGCLKSERNFEDLSGKQYGELVVIKQADDYVSPKNTHMRQWLCQCSCGKQIITTENRLKAGRVKSCGHPENLVGQRFEKLTVLYRAEDLTEKGGKHRTVWHCKCDCGNECDVTAHALKSGNTTSCGCVKKQMYEDNRVDITDVRQKNGYLVGIREIEPEYTVNGEKKPMWLCKCLRCGNLTEVSLNHFTTGNKKSCGCIRRSYGEALVEDYLKAHKLNFRTEVTFKGFVGEGNRPYRYDFGLYENKELICLIEYHGKQHYEPSWSSSSVSAQERYKIQKKHDEVKREYAQKIDVPLIEIPYTEDSYEAVSKFLDDALSNILK